MEALAFIVMGFVMGLYFSDVYDDYLKRKYSLQQEGYTMMKYSRGAFY